MALCQESVGFFYCLVIVSQSFDTYAWCIMHICFSLLVLHMLISQKERLLSVKCLIMITSQMLRYIYSVLTIEGRRQHYLNEIVLYI